MEYMAVLNNYLEYSLDDNHAVDLFFQSTSMHVFHATVSMYFHLCHHICKVRTYCGKF